MPTLRERKKRKTNETIVAEAARLFKANGFANTTIDEIAAAAEVGVGTLYNYYANKYELLLEVVETFVSDNLAEAEKLISKPYDDPVEHLVDFIMLLAEQWFVMEHRLMADIFIATFQNYEKFANGVLKQDVRDIDMITKLFETLKERGQIDESTDSYLAAVSMHGMIAIDFMILIFVPEAPSRRT